MTEIRLNTSNEAFMDMLAYWDFEYPSESQDAADILPWMPNHPVVQWCHEHLPHPVEIHVGLSENWNSAGPYHECFEIRAVFRTRSDALLFKLTWG